MRFSAYLYDSACLPLKVSNIDLELYDTASNKQLDRKTSGQIGTANEWGAILSWNPPIAGAIEILCNDPTHSYSGHAVMGINGKLSGRLDIILERLPTGVGMPLSGQWSRPRLGLQELNEWVESNQAWSASEKSAVRKLISNFGTVVVARTAKGTLTPELVHVASNWARALTLVGISVDWIDE